MANGLTAYKTPQDPTSQLNAIGSVSIMVGNLPFEPPGGESSSSGYTLTALPTLSWSKRANYNFQPIIGRASPVVTYSHSESKTVSITIPMHCPTRIDMQYHIAGIHYLAAALHPQYDNTYAPPPICRMIVGNKGHSSNASPLSSFRFVMLEMRQGMNPDTAWDPEYMMPRSWDIEITAETFYQYSELPGAKDVVKGLW